MKTLVIALCTAMVMFGSNTSSSAIKDDLEAVDAELEGTMSCDEYRQSHFISARFAMPLSFGRDPLLTEISAKISRAANVLSYICDRPIGLIIISPVSAGDAKVGSDPTPILLAAINRIKARTGAEVLLVVGANP